ncbi:hypothetical protein D3C79_742440 [compost metagenome]
MMTGQDHRTGGEEQQRLEERVGHQVEDGRIPCLHAQRQEHVANLAHGGIGKYAFDVGLHQRGKARQQQRNATNDTDQIQHFRRHQEQAMHTGNQVDTCGNHGCRVDQCRYRGWTRHRICQPGLQRQLSRFTDCATQ